MQLIPFTKDEAIDICDDFEDLIGTKFSNEDYTLCKISDVVVAPFGDELFKIYMSYYVSLANKSEAIGFYTGNDYDVYVLAHEVEDSSLFHYVTIRDYAELKGVTYTFPVQ